MHKKYKALMIDVDGTLIPNFRNASPSKKVIDSIKKANKKIHVGIATARPMTELRSIFDAIPFSGPSIINGGSQIINLPSKIIVKEIILDVWETLQIIKKAKKFGFKEIIVNDDGKDINIFNGYNPKRPFQIYIPSQSEKIADQFLQDISHLPNVSAHKTVSWKQNSLDIVVTNSLATKQHGILEVARILDISPFEIIGVGDGYNDFPLLMACGLKIAMGNAVTEIKEIADYIAPSVKNNGLVDVIEKFVL